jgi:hypothetical protein
MGWSKNRILNSENVSANENGSIALPFFNLYCTNTS